MAGGNSEVISTFAVLVSRFSWELVGSTTSLQGTDVLLVGRDESRLPLVLSLRVWRAVGVEEDSSRLAEEDCCVEGDELTPLLLPGAGVLVKKPRMLCCLPLPVDGAVPVFFAADVGFAGVRAAAAVFSPMVESCQKKINELFLGLTKTTKKC